MIEVKDMKETTLGQDSVLGQLSALGHEQVVFCNDAATGLKAIIAIHNTVCGPSLGGTRMWPYASEAEALTDVLRLSRGMTYKSAISGLNLGGGKAVIIGDSRTQKNEALFRRFGKFVNSLAGKYITAEDVGVTTKDIEYIAMETNHVAGKPEHMGGSGDPSPVTAYGVYMGIKASAKKAYGNDSLNGKIVVVQGAGNVGAHLVDHLVHEGAIVKLFDIHEDKVAAIVNKHSKVQAITANEVYSTPMDIYAPCALGATVNDETLPQLKCQIIAGAANNQLKEESKHGIEVLNRGMLYAPDFLINAGGVINCYAEVVGTDRKAALKHTENIYNTTLNIYEMSSRDNIPTYLAANILAEQRIASIGALKQTF